MPIEIFPFDYQLIGDATLGTEVDPITEDEYEVVTLTAASGGQNGGMIIPIPITQAEIDLAFQFAIDQPSEDFIADGMAWSFLDQLYGTSGGYLGLPDNLGAGFAVVIDTFSNQFLADAVPQLQIRVGDQTETTAFGETNLLASSGQQLSLVSPNWQDGYFYYNRDTQQLNCELGGISLNAEITIDNSEGFFFRITAATGFWYSRQRIRFVRSAGVDFENQPPPPDPAPETTYIYVGPPTGAAFRNGTDYLLYLNRSQALPFAADHPYAQALIDIGYVEPQ
ncbi:MAG: hypothetical protein OHK0012_07440 [Synechococcales cyanobacterium]